jgi:hypothetical protein
MDDLVFCQWNRFLGGFDVSGTHVHCDRFDALDLIFGEKTMTPDTFDPSDTTKSAKPTGKTMF